MHDVSGREFVGTGRIRNQPRETHRVRMGRPGWQEFNWAVRRLPPLILAVFLASLTSARAQDCSGPLPSACPLLDSAKAIFVGTVTGHENESGTRNFHVTEAFKGVNGDDVVLNEFPSAFNFIAGEQYLVFAVPCPWKGAGRQCLTVWPCSSTRPLDTAAAILEQLRAESNGKRVAAVYGTLERTLGEEPADGDEAYPRPLPNIPVRLKSGVKSYETRTDEQGAYGFAQVSPGKYQVSADLPPDLELGQLIGNQPIKPFELPRRCCFENNLYAVPAGRISGKVIGPDGKSLRVAFVYLYRASQYTEGKSGIHSFQGKAVPLDAWKPFEFYHLPAGDYVLVFNPKNEQDPDAPFPTTFYPGATDLESAQRIHLSDGQKISDADIHVNNPLATRQITIRFDWGGRNPNDFLRPDVIVKASGGNRPFPERSDPTAYALNLLLSARYTMHAEAFCRMGTKGKAETGEVTVDGSDLSTSDVVLKFATGDCVRQ
jgi:hypothetical protein